MPSIPSFQPSQTVTLLGFTRIAEDAGAAATQTRPLLPTLATVENRAATLPTYDEAIHKMHGIAVQAEIDLRPSYIRGNQAHMTEDDRKVGHAEGVRWQSLAAEIEAFIELPTTMENGVSRVWAESPLQAIITWTEVMTLYPRIEYTENRDLDTVQLHQDVQQRLKDFSCTLKDYASQVSSGPRASDAPHFSDFSVKIDTFIESIQ